MSDTKTIEIPRPKPQIIEGLVQPAEHAHTAWSVTVPAEHTLDDALDPGYLWNAHRRLRAGDTLELTHVTHEFYGLYYVMKVDEVAQAVIMAPIIAAINLRNAPVRLPTLSEVKFEYKGDVHRWCVVQGKANVSKGHLTEEAAREWHEAATAEHAAAAKKKGKAA